MEITESLIESNDGPIFLKMEGIENKEYINVDIIKSEFTNNAMQESLIKLNYATINMNDSSVSNSVLFIKAVRPVAINLNTDNITEMNGILFLKKSQSVPNSELQIIDSYFGELTVSHRYDYGLYIPIEFDDEIVIKNSIFESTQLTFVASSFSIGYQSMSQVTIYDSLFKNYIYVSALSMNTLHQTWFPNISVFNSQFINCNNEYPNQLPLIDIYNFSDISYYQTNLMFENCLFQQTKDVFVIYETMTNHSTNVNAPLISLLNCNITQTTGLFMLHQYPQYPRVNVYTESVNYYANVDQSKNTAFFFLLFILQYKIVMFFMFFLNKNTHTHTTKKAESPQFLVTLSENCGNLWTENVDETDATHRISNCNFKNNQITQTMINLHCVNALFTQGLFVSNIFQTLNSFIFIEETFLLIENIELNNNAFNHASFLHETGYYACFTPKYTHTHTHTHTKNK